MHRTLLLNGVGWHYIDSSRPSALSPSSFRAPTQPHAQHTHQIQASISSNCGSWASERSPGSRSPPPVGPEQPTPAASVSPRSACGRDPAQLSKHGRANAVDAGGAGIRASGRPCAGRASLSVGPETSAILEQAGREVCCAHGSDSRHASAAGAATTIGFDEGTVSVSCAGSGPIGSAPDPAGTSARGPLTGVPRRLRKVTDGHRFRAASGRAIAVRRDRPASPVGEARVWKPISRRDHARPAHAGCPGISAPRNARPVGAGFCGGVRAKAATVPRDVGCPIRGGAREDCNAVATDVATAAVRGDNRAIRVRLAPRSPVGRPHDTARAGVGEPLATVDRTVRQEAKGRQRLITARGAVAIGCK